MNDRRLNGIQQSAAEQAWLAFEELVRGDHAAFFEGNAPIAGARAPGRLDVMGGVADYSGSLVLEMPIAEAAYVAWQWREDRTFHIRSTAASDEGLSADVQVALDTLIDDGGRVRPVEEVRASLGADPRTRWAAYIAGCYYVMAAAYTKVSDDGRVDDRMGELGANILLRSDVPLGAGLSSSAAIEVAAMHALSTAAGIHPSDLTLAAWCQRVENEVVGAPCGIMDQVASALGQQNALTVLRCQPHDLLGAQAIPKGWRFTGIDSRVKHSVGGSHYTQARVGAFMGLKVIQLESGGKLLQNYLCRMSSIEFAAFRDLIPEVIRGSEYTELYGRLPDTVTRVEAGATYRPRACAEHPVLENYRVHQFAGIMQVAELRRAEREESGKIQIGLIAEDRMLMAQAGELMYEFAHASYSDRLDLGSPETDLLVQLVRNHGPECGLYGAKITGGGSGGTVAVLSESDSSTADAALSEICAEYARQTGIVPRQFAGSSPGAVAFGGRHILRG